MASTTTTQTAPPASGGGCTPHLKRVLKSYQASAVSSLQGPPALMAAAAADPGLADEDEPLEAPALPAIQQPPLLTPPDQAQGSERDETQLEWHSISCFSVGGERRLCMPQILNTVLMDFSLQQINSVCDELQIFCLRSNPEQLDVLKRAGVIPSSAPSCGLITKSDAERLCAALLHAGTPPDANNPGSPGVVVPVYHECFGGASGVVWLDAGKVRCADCGLLFSPRRFVCHAHQRSREARTCHWGFDSARWRHYLLLDDRREPLEDAMRALLQQFKDKFPDASKRKQSPPLPGEALCKKRAVRSAALVADGDGFMAVGLDPALWYQQSQWARASAFKPWSPAGMVGGVLRPAKALQAPLLEQPPPVYLKGGSLAYPVEAYIPADIAQMQKLGPAVLKADPDRPDMMPTLQHLKKAGGPDEVVPKKEHMQTSCSRAAEAMSVPAGKLVNGRLSADTDETMSNSSLSTLSGVEDVGVPGAEEGKELPVVPELRGLWVAFERHSLGERARQDIMREVNLLLSAYQQRHLLTGYKLLFQQRQEAEPMSCKLGSMPKGGTDLSPHLPLSAVPSSPPGAELPSLPPAAASSPVNLSEGKEEDRSPQRATPVEPHPMLLTA